MMQNLYDDDGRGHGQAMHGIAGIQERSRGGMARTKLFDPDRTAKAKIIIFRHRNNMLGSAVCMQWLLWKWLLEVSWTLSYG